MARLRWPPYLIIALIYVAAAFIVDPRGEFPLNDDWSYARSTFRLALDHRLQVDEWCAMSLVGQSLYGAVLTNFLGPSFLALRLSTLALSCGLAWMLWSIFQRLQVPQSDSWMAVLSWIFNPIQFYLSFTYMTEIPFLFFVGLGLYFYVRYRTNGQAVFLVLSGTALGYAFLIRQTAVLFLIALSFILLTMEWKQALSQRLGKIVRLSGAAAVFIAGYYLWLLFHGGATPATHRKFQLLGQITSEQVGGNLYGLLFYVSFMLLPLLMWQITHLGHIARESGIRLGGLIGWGIFSGSGLWWFKAHYGGQDYMMSRAFHERMPFLLNVLYDTGLGPLTLDPTYYEKSPTPVYPQIWWVITWVAAAGLVWLGLLSTRGLLRTWSHKVDPRVSPSVLFGIVAFLLIAVFEIVFSHLQEGGLFDRHILLAVLPLLLVLTPLHRSVPRISFGWKTGVAGMAILVLAVSAYFCVTATHDYFQWNRLRWKFGNELLVDKVDPLSIAGGFEFNGWHNYDTFRARGNAGKIYYWWYDRRTYLISMTPQEGYRIIKRFEYFSWVHRRLVPVYLLRAVTEVEGNHFKVQSSKFNLPKE